VSCKVMNSNRPASRVSGQGTKFRKLPVLIRVENSLCELKFKFRSPLENGSICIGVLFSSDFLCIKGSLFRLFKNQISL